MTDAIAERICILKADGVEPADILAKCFHECKATPEGMFNCDSLPECPRLKEMEG